MFGDLAEIDVLRQRHGAGVNSQNLQTRLTVGNANLDFAVESTGAAQCGIENLWNVRRANHNDLAACDKPIHQAKQLGDHTLFDFACNLGALGSYGIDFVDKENGGSVPCRFFEYLTKLSLALAVKLAHDLGTVEVNEVHPTLSRDRACQQSLAGAWRAVEQHAFRSENPQTFEDARILQRQLDDFADSCDLAL